MGGEDQSQKIPGAALVLGISAAGKSIGTDVNILDSLMAGAFPERLALDGEPLVHLKAVCWPGDQGEVVERFGIDSDPLAHIVGQS
jgi:hypothetical protein